MMKLILRKEDNETWLECARRYAKKYGLEEEIKESYNDNIKDGEDEAQAAWNACYEWDILEISYD